MNERIIDNIKNDLGKKEYSLLQTNIALTSQGYLVNDAKENRLMLINIVQQAYDNSNIFTAEQHRELDNLVMKL